MVLVDRSQSVCRRDSLWQDRGELPLEAPILIPIDHGQEFINRGHGRRWLVPLPLHLRIPDELPNMASRLDLWQQLENCDVPCVGIKD